MTEFISRRNILKGTLALGFAAALPAAAQAKGAPPRWLPQDWNFYKGEPRDLRSYSLVYFGTATKLKGVSCGDDLSFLRGYAAQVHENSGHAVQPVFVCPQGQGDNITQYIDADDSFVCLQGAQKSVVDYVHANYLGQYTPKTGPINWHTSMAHLVAPDGTHLKGVFMNNTRNPFGNPVYDFIDRIRAYENGKRFPVLSVPSF